MADTTVKGFFDSLESNLNKDTSRLAGMNCVYQFALGPEAYSVTLADGKAAVAKGAAASPNCTVTMTEADFVEMISGRLNPQMAFMTGKLKVAGDMGLALKLGSFLG